MPIISKTINKEFPSAGAVTERDTTTLQETRNAVCRGGETEIAGYWWAQNKSFTRQLGQYSRKASCIVHCTLFHANNWWGQYSAYPKHQMHLLQWICLSLRFWTLATRFAQDLLKTSSIASTTIGTKHHPPWTAPWPRRKTISDVATSVRPAPQW